MKYVCFRFVFSSVLLEQYRFLAAVCRLCVLRDRSLLLLYYRLTISTQRVQHHFQYHRSRQCYRLWEAIRSLIAQIPITLTAKFAQSLSLTLFEAAACNSAHLVDRRHPGRDAAEPCRRNGKSAQLAQHTEGWEHKRSDRDVALATTIGILGVFAHIGRRLCTCRITHKTAGNIQSMKLGDGTRFLFRDDEVPDDGEAIAGNISQCGTKARWLLAARHKNRWNSSSKMP